MAISFRCVPAVIGLTLALPCGAAFAHKAAGCGETVRPIRPELARALEQDRHEQAQRFLPFKPDGTPLRARTGTGRAKVEVRGWDPVKKEAATGKAGHSRLQRLTCRGEDECVAMIAVAKACAPRTVKCTRQACSCLPRR